MLPGPQLAARERRAQGSAAKTTGTPNRARQVELMAPPMTAMAISASTTLKRASFEAKCR